MVESLVTEVGTHPGQVFPMVLKLALVATVVLLALHLLLSWLGRARSSAPLASWTLWDKLIYLVLLGTVLGLASTAFYPVLAGNALANWLLLAHMSSAGTFVTILPLIALTWAMSCRFGRPDSSAASERFSWLGKLSFWLILVGGIVTAGTMFLSMIPILDTDGLHQMLDIHRYSGLLVVVAVIVHLYSVLLGRLGLN